ncbi:MobF family relaxase [Aureimonas psammosilenae]|uniref:MobF family relaxase n=1 Tax=Aureimonas psammosilenae TaxID=2495496 RepID=UPI00186998FC|nr:MobF family relaxase [Aureimonas psammosilenae]
MFNCTRITSVEYYLAQKAQAQADAKRPDPNQGRDREAYYLDNGAAESEGKWWTRRAASSLPKSSSSLLPLSPFGQNGTAVNDRHFRDLAAGRHPVTKEPLTKASANGKRSVGFDLQIGAPKSVSVLAAVVDDDTRARVFAAHDKAMERALNFAFDAGMVTAHRAKRDPLTGKKSYFEEPVQEASAATFRHFTSRAMDPQLHSHAVILNLGVREDGSTGAIDNRRLKLYGGAISSLYRCELAKTLREELGVEVVQKGRNFEIAGIPDAVTKQFSKRRAEIEAVAKAEGFTTASARGKAQVASFETRDDKDKAVTMQELEARWNRELQTLGWDGNSLMRSALAEGRLLRAERAKDEGDQIDKAAGKAIHDLTRNAAVMDDRHVVRAVLEGLQTLCGADEALAAVDRLKASGLLVQIGELDGRPIYSTAEIIAAEKAMLQTVKARQGEREFVPEAAVRAAIARRPTIREDQAAAILHALNKDGVSVVEGSAGSGKSFSLGAVAEVARECGLEVWTVAPSWKATEVVRSDTQTADAYAKAVQGFVRQIADGKVKLTEKSVVILDEAGMVGTEDMAALVAATSAVGAKLIASGDTRQLQPVVAGAPLKAISRVVGSSRMTEITRQKSEWQKAASQDFADGETVRALEAYDKAGAVTVADDREEAIRALVDSYSRDRMERPEAARCVLSSWNVDVRSLNEQIRAAGKAAGWIEATDWTLPAIPRGGDDAQAIDLAAGDEVIFGETVELRGMTIRNSDLARVVGISGDPENPTLRLAFAKSADPIEVRWRELVGRREEGEPQAPRLQHASAMTVHASQGVTVDEAYVLNVRGMGQESTYVAMTRHRNAVKTFADGGRIVDEIAAKGGATIRQTKGGGTVLPEEEDDRAPVEVTAEEIKRRLFEESMKADLKQNATDFLPMHVILDTPAPVVVTVPRNETRPPVQSATVFKDATLAGRRPRLPTPSMQPTVSASPVTKLAERMAKRETAKTRYPVPVKSEPRSRVTDDERNQMVRTDLLAFAVDHLGGQLVERWSGGGAVRFGGKDGEKVGITQKGNLWAWTVSNDTSRKGVIWDLVQHVKGGSYGETLHWLRDRLKTWSPSATALPIVREQKPLEDATAPEKVRAGWMKLPSAGVPKFLTEERGIRREIVERFRSDIKADWTGEKASNRFGAAFAHRNPDGELVNYVRRGAPPIGKVDSFRANASGGTPTLFMAGDRSPKRIYVTESAIDTLSLYQHDDAPDGAMLVAPDGTPGRRALDAVAEIARRNPEAEWHVGLDNDGKGQEFANQVREAIRRGHVGAVVKDRPPEAQFKDWNGAIRGATAEQEKAAKAARAAQVEAERIEIERRAAEEERRRLAAERAATAPVPSVPSGPRMR